MQDFMKYMREHPVDEATASSLTAKCQENDWVREGGYAWQDDPYLEEYPYDYLRLEDMEDLRRFFAAGNWALRQGALYEDLAFIQQVDGGDEWWTLVRISENGDAADWLAFESVSFNDTVNYPNEFERELNKLINLAAAKREKLSQSLATKAQAARTAAVEISESNPPQTRHSKEVI